MVSIDEKYSILVSGHVLEDTDHRYGIGGGMNGRQISLPQEKSQYLLQEYIGWHREIFLRNKQPTNHFKKTQNIR